MTNGHPDPDGLPPRKETTFEYFNEKLREIQREGWPTDKQLAIIDWWTAKLIELKVKVQTGKPI